MAHLWLRDSHSQWAVLPLGETRVPLDGTLPGLARGGDRGDVRAELVPWVPPDRKREWLLLARDAAGLQVNGLSLPLGVRVLRDGDGIRMGSLGTAFFSTETLARVEEFPGPDAVDCARCNVAIEPGFLAVRCPSCDAWFHQGPAEEGKDRRCYDYALTCAFCPHGTRLDAGYEWSPEDL